jgi:hypothetical protein
MIKRYVSRRPRTMMLKRWNAIVNKRKRTIRFFFVRLRVAYSVVRMSRT